jgi:hypothetical protein
MGALISHRGNLAFEAFDIFKRLGGRIFSTGNPSPCLYASFKGGIQPSAGYPYPIKTCSLCGEIFITGILMPIR